VSRIPRFQENLKTGFTAEAVSAARYRACAARAESDGLPNLARRWLRLAAVKDSLAVMLLEAAGQVHGLDADLGTAVAEERYENDVLYPKLIRDSESSAAAELFGNVVAAQQEHLRALEELRRELNASQGDVALPPEVDQGGSAGRAAAASAAGQPASSPA
jgi:rubrerythrin